MADRSQDQIKGEIEAERAQLKDAVGSFREQVDRARRRLPYVVAGVFAGAIVLRAVANRTARRL